MYRRVHACSFQVPYALSVCSLVKTIKDKSKVFLYGNHFRLSHYAKILLQHVMTKRRRSSFLTPLHLWHVITDCGKWKLQESECQMILRSYEIFWKFVKFFKNLGEILTDRDSMMISKTYVFPFRNIRRPLNKHVR